MARKIYRISYLIDVSGVGYLMKEIADDASRIRRSDNIYVFAKSKDDLEIKIFNDQNTLQEMGAIVTRTDITELTKDEYLHEAFESFINLALMNNVDASDPNYTVSEAMEDLKKDDIKLCFCVNSLLDDIKMQIDDEIFGGENPFNDLLVNDDEVIQ